MHIEVWRKYPIGKPHRLREGLTIFLSEGAAYASWPLGPVVSRSAIRIPVTDALAAQVLGAVRSLCPYMGQAATYSFGGGDGFTHYGETIAEHYVTSQHCRECGFQRSFFDNPIPHANSGAYDHPVTTRLGPPLIPGITFRAVDQLTTARWDTEQGRLTTCDPSEEGRLIIWVFGNSKRTAFQVAFPDAQILQEADKYAVLCTTPSRHTSA